MTSSFQMEIRALSAISEFCSLAWHSWIEFLLGVRKKSPGRSCRILLYLFILVTSVAVTDLIEQPMAEKLKKLSDRIQRPGGGCPQSFLVRNLPVDFRWVLAPGLREEDGRLLADA